MADEPKRLMMVENEAGMIRSVREALEDVHRLRFIGYLTTSVGLEAMLDDHAPDIALVDLGLMQRTLIGTTQRESQTFDEGLNIISLISELSPHTVIICFSNYLIMVPELAKQAMARGANALIAKQNGPSDRDSWKDRFVAQIFAVVDGWWRPSPEVAQLIAEEETQHSLGQPESLPLTARQLEVLRLMALGRTDLEIATELDVEAAAVRGHITNIRRRLQVRYRWQLIETARVSGIVSDETK